MTFISENIIDQITVELEDSPAHYERAVTRLGEEQPHILSYLVSESFDVLTNPEKEYLLFLALVIWRSVKKEFTTLSLINEADLGQIEEVNWELLQNSKAKQFRDRLTVFFEGYPQEDLLAFVEDALVIDDEQEVITKEGREPMFIALRTIIDVLTVNAK